MDDKSAAITKGTGLINLESVIDCGCAPRTPDFSSMFELVRFLAVFWLAAAVLYAFSDLMPRVLLPVADPIMHDSH